MDASFDALLAAFARFREPEPADLVASIRGLPEPGVLPSPWETWTLVGLTRHHRRQLWVAEIVRNRLQGAPSDPEPHLWITSLKFLLRHGHRADEVLALLARAGRIEVGEAVLLALEHAPELALPLIR